MRNVVKHFVVVDASQPLDDVVRAVTEVISNYYRDKVGGKLRVGYEER